MRPYHWLKVYSSRPWFFSGAVYRSIQKTLKDPTERLCLTYTLSNINSMVDRCIANSKPSEMRSKEYWQCVSLNRSLPRYWPWLRSKVRQIQTEGRIPTDVNPSRSNTLGSCSFLECIAFIAKSKRHSIGVDSWNAECRAPIVRAFETRQGILPSQHRDIKMTRPHLNFSILWQHVSIFLFSIQTFTYQRSPTSIDSPALRSIRSLCIFSTIYHLYSSSLFQQSRYQNCPVSSTIYLDTDIHSWSDKLHQLRIVRSTVQHLPQLHPLRKRITIDLPTAAPAMFAKEILILARPDPCG